MTKEEFIKKWGKKVTGKNYTASLHNYKMKRDLDTIENVTNITNGRFQLCPKCNGQGIVSKTPWIAGDVESWMSSESSYECDVCNDKKIIPIPSENCEIVENKEETTYPESGLSDYELELEKIVEKIKDLTIIEGIALLKNNMKPQRPVNPSTEPIGLNGAFIYITFLILGIVLGISIGIFISIWN